MNKEECLKLGSKIHNDIKTEILNCQKTNIISINEIELTFLEITIMQLRNFIEHLIKIKVKELANFQLNFGLAFPIGISGDCIVAHYTPTILSANQKSTLPYYLNPDSKIHDFKIIKIDYGIQINGYIIDKAFSLNLDNSELTTKLIDASKTAVSHIIEKIGEDVRLNELAQDAIEIVSQYEHNEKPLKVVKNVYSHNINQWQIHGSKFIRPDYKKYDFDDKAKLNEQYAIEIYVTDGEGQGELITNPIVHSHYNISDEVSFHQEEDKNKILHCINTNFRTLPFCPNFFPSIKSNKKKISHSKINSICQSLQSEGILNSYPPIIEINNKSLVSQIENNVLITSYGGKEL
jgi:methionyl aminopeptidase